MKTRVTVKQKPNTAILERAVTSALQQIRSRLEDSRSSSEIKKEKLMEEI